jgi:hypothetical protein
MAIVYPEATRSLYRKCRREGTQSRVEFNDFFSVGCAAVLETHQGANQVLRSPGPSAPILDRLPIVGSGNTFTEDPMSFKFKGPIINAKDVLEFKPEKERRIKMNKFEVPSSRDRFRDPCDFAWSDRLLRTSQAESSRRCPVRFDLRAA